MAWRYTFDGGPEKPLEASSLYMVAAMTAFALEGVADLRVLVPGYGIKEYHGHVLKLWDDELLKDYPPSLYGIGIDECSNLKIVMLGKAGK